MRCVFNEWRCDQEFALPPMNNFVAASGFIQTRNGGAACGEDADITRKPFGLSVVGAQTCRFGKLTAAVIEV
jgi:hypothetical protein